MKRMFTPFSSDEVRNMTIRMKHREKFMAILLLIAMFLSLVPYQAIAEEFSDTKPVTEEITEVDDQVYNLDVDASDIPVISEDTSKRQLNEKHFRKQDGSYEVAIYDSAVHYKDGDDWIDIDNRLDYDTKTKTYNNKSNQFDIQFPKNITKSDVKLSMGKYDISWHLLGSKSSEVLVASEKMKVNEQDLRELINISQEVTYKNIMQDIDLVYTLEGSKIKEDIIVNKYQEDLSFEFEYKVKGLSFIEVDGQLVLVNEEGEAIFSFDPFVMYDNLDNYSSDITYEIKEISNNKYSFKVIPDENWLMNASYPVRIDPSLNSTTTSMSIFDTYISEANPDAKNYNLSYMYVSGTTSTTEYRGLLYFTLPTEVMDQTITYAKLGFDKHTTTSGQINIYKNNENFSSSTATWNNAPSYSSKVIDYYTINSNTPFMFDITKPVKEWQATGVRRTTGFTIALDDNYGSFNSVYQNVTSGSHNPVITIGYESPKGLKDYWTYTSQDLGPAGQGYVSDYTGHLTWVRNDYALKNEYMSLSLDMIYNHEYSSTQSNEGYGIGWKTSYNQQILHDDDLDQYYLLKPDGEKIFFVLMQIENVYSGVDQYTWLAENGSGMSLTYSTYQGNVQGNLNLESQEGIKYTFESSNLGRLTRITNTKNGHFLVVSYVDTTTLKVSQVTDTVGNKITLTYYSDKLIRSNLYLVQENGLHKLIEYKRYTYNSSSELTSLISYSNYDDNLATTVLSHSLDEEIVSIQALPGIIIITPPDEPDPDPDPNQGYASSNKINYVYNSNDSLFSVELENSEQKIIYTSDTLDRITQINLSDSNQPVSNIDIEYAHQKTIYSDDLGNNTTYLFDNYGHTINIQDNKGNAQYFKYAGLFTYVGLSEYDFNYSEIINANPNYFLVHKLLTKSDVLKQTQNQVSNHGFEHAGGWTLTANSTGHFSYSSDYSVFGQRSMAITNSGSNPYASQNFYLEPGYYTVYGYIKNDGSLVNGKGAFLEISNATSATYQEDDQISNSDSWKSYKIDFYISTARSVTLKLCNESISTAYFDNIQLYEGFSESRYNVLSNSGFENSTTGWTRSNAYITTNNNASGMDDILGRYSMYISGDGSTEKYFYQQVYSLASSAGETFMIGGWGKAPAVPHKSYATNSIYDDNRFFGIYIDFTCIAPDEEGGVTYHEFVYLPFNTNTEDWQYQMTTFEMPVDVVSAKVYGAYQGEGTAYFDNIQMYHDNVATAYDYDGSTGYVTEVENKDGTITSYTYDSDGNLTGIETNDQPTDITYNNANMVETIEQNNVRVTVEYNPTTKHVENEYIGYDKDSTTQDKWFKTSTSYIYNSQYIHTQTDEFGNVTTYEYNEHTGLLSEIINDEGGSVTYSYNDLGQVLEKTFGADVTYEYGYDDEHRLNTLTVSGVTYEFTYDDVDHLTDVYIDNELIVHYDYYTKPNQIGTESYVTDLLERKTYGNGDYYYFKYNDEDMLVGVYFNETSNPSYEYEYDANGRLGSVLDHVNNNAYYYSYDLAGKLERITDASDNKIFYRYDEQGNLAEYEYHVSGVEREVMYHYNDITGEYDYTSYLISNNDYVEKTYDYSNDSLKRLDEITLSINHYDILTMMYNYSDISVQQGNATTRIYEIVYDFSSATDFKYRYQYDGNQNITQIKKLQGTTIIEQYDYHYDNLNQLIREDINLTGSSDYSYTYKYDGLGNLIKITKYNYHQSQEDIIDEDDVNTGEYFDPYTYKTVLTYDGIQLVKIDAYNETGQVVERDYDFDDLGNLLDTVDYYDIHSVDYNWSGRRLDGINIYDDGAITQSIEYKYNSEGIRTFKKITIGEEEYEYEYVLDGNLVLVEFINGNPIYYTYDANDQLLSMNYNGSEYFYVFDLLGNVIGLMNESGQLVVTYTYDAWGNQRVVAANGVENQSPIFIGNINPYRYRGYRYDTETGYYYLQARYYDPEIGRFISIDDANYISDDASSSINLYAYAVNNPIMNIDPSGNEALTLATLALIGIAAIVVYAATILMLKAAQEISDAAPNSGFASGVADSIRDIGDDITSTLEKIGSSIRNKAKELIDSVVIPIAVAITKPKNKNSGVYVIAFADGESYVGKGGILRVIASAVRHSVEDTTIPVAIIWMPAENEREAFKMEYIIMCNYGFGTDGSQLKNKIWSPGRNFYLQDHGSYYYLDPLYGS